MSQHNERTHISTSHHYTIPAKRNRGWTHWHLKTDLIVQRLNQHRLVHNLPPQEPESP